MLHVRLDKNIKKLNMELNKKRCMWNRNDAYEVKHNMQKKVIIETFMSVIGTSHWKNKTCMLWENRGQRTYYWYT